MLTRGERKRLLKRAQTILARNWRGSYTAPSADLYVHQWSWDSAFCAVGYANYNLSKALTEIKSLFAGQWQNGMLPHIIFRGGGRYWPDAKFWQSHRSKFSSSLPTSALIQPPIHAMAVWYIYQRAAVGRSRDRVIEFIKFIYPKLLAWHRYLASKRDPEGVGLITIFHPWESGLDNSPRWDLPLQMVKPRDDFVYLRSDSQTLPANQRPNKELYDKYIYLVELFKQVDYNEEKFYSITPFKVKDAAASALFYYSNLCLRKLAWLIGEDTTEIDKWLAAAKNNLWRRLGWERTPGLIYDFDLVSQRQLRVKTVASFFGLLTDLLTLKQAQIIRDFMHHARLCHHACQHDHYLLLSLSSQSDQFNPLNYWRGPIWINVNWLIYRGLIEQGLLVDAEMIKEAMLELVSQQGFYEYYDPFLGKGIGSKDFSWTAALVIDLLRQG